jgi:Ca2+-binding RTX toxin-like protein
VEGLSGWKHNDLLVGTSFPIGVVDAVGGGVEENLGFQSRLTQAGVDRIHGLQQIVGGAPLDDPDATILDPSNGTDIILGGDGSDTIQGKAGDDIIDGDAWLNVRISVRANKDGTGAELFSVDTARELQPLLLNREINPGQLTIVREILWADGHNDVDVAVYSGNRSEYEILDFGNSDGFFIVAHTNPVLVGNALSDGIDTLRNIERVRFADQTVTLINLAPVGAPAISDITPTEGEMITASLGTLIDYDGMPAPGGYSYQWQVLTGGSWTNIGGATGASFTPTQAVVNHQLRVQVSYTDGGGTLETVASAATAVVGDLFIGGHGADTPTLTAGADHAFGNNGNDTLDGGAGADTLEGGMGYDHYIVDDVGDVVVEAAGGGIDTVRALMSYTLGSEVEHLQLIGTGGDSGTGNELANMIIGNAANNSLSGLSGNDSLFGQDGDDTLDGGVGADALVGGFGNDTFIVDDVDDRVLENSGQGIDLVLASISFTLTSSVENLTLTGTTNINGSGNVLANIITGNDGNNMLFGDAGVDTLFGGLGNDTLDGGSGNDSLIGGAGDDTYIVSSSGEILVELAGGGIDLAISSTGYALAAEVENLTLTGALAINGDGNVLTNAIIGNDGANRLRGFDGSDTLSGGDGNDTLIGGAGADVLDGGAGLDAFRYDSASEGGDTIIGYVGAEDRIQISVSGFGGGLTTGTNLLATGRYMENVGGFATNAIGQFAFDTSTQTLWWDVDGTGAADRVMIASVVGATGWSVSELQLFA